MMVEKENYFETLEDAWKQAIKDLKDESIQAVEIHWGHGTHTLVQATTEDPKQPYKGWEIVEDA